MKTFQVRTRSRAELVDVTGEVARIIAESGILEGLATVYVPHTTAGVTINENADPDVKRDIIAFMDRLIPRDWGFRHIEGNSDAHIKASMMGFSAQIPVTGGRPALGTWQGIYFAEFDGPRSRKCHVTVTPSR
ncbi:MAG: hypothetical protein C0609_11285 [Deltaproteobacteria bacterium]|nr:MAG: hypothetical protein C0609_11285 [Deltaproteobacteria bacterium]